MPKVTSIRLSDDLVDRIDRIARSLDRSRGWVIRQALVGYVEQHEPHPSGTSPAVEEPEPATTWPRAHQRVIDALEHMIEHAGEDAAQAAASEASATDP